MAEEETAETTNESALATMSPDLFLVGRTKSYLHGKHLINHYF